MGRPSPPPATQTTRRPSLPASPAPSHTLSPSPALADTHPTTPFDPNRPRRSLPPVPLGIEDLEDAREEGLPAYEEEPEDEEITVGLPALDHLSRVEPKLESGRYAPEQRNSAAQANGGEADGEAPRAGLRRFGRWRDWVEKRANERDEDESRGDRRAARRELPNTPNPPSYDSTLPGPVRYLPPAAHPTSLTNTSLLRIDYGSAFIPHSNSSIACALPILEGRLVILGTSTGLRVLNTDDEDNPTRSIWYGLPVWELRVIDFTPVSQDDAGNSPATSGRERGAASHTPKGTIAVLCGGVEDSSRISRPKRSSGSELRLYSLSSMISLARYSAMQPKSYAGIDLSPVPTGKGKSKSKEIEWTMIDRSSIGYLRSLSLLDPSPAPAFSELPLAWSKAYTLLPSSSGSGGGSGGKGGASDVQLLATYSSSARIFVAVGTSTHVVIHGCYPSAFDEEERGNLRFNASRTFYLPAQPVSISFIKLPSYDLSIPQEQGVNGYGYVNEADDVASLFSYDDRASIRTGRSGSTSTGAPQGTGTSASLSSAPPPHTDSDSDSIPSLGLYVSFGSKACLIRVSDSAVLDFKLKKPGSSSTDGGSGGKGDWGSLETLSLYGGGEVYVLTRGKETFLISAPFEIPSHFNTSLATVLWPESPCSVSSTVEYTSPDTAAHRSSFSSGSGSGADSSSENVNIRLIATSFTGNLHIQQLTFSTTGHLGTGAHKNRAKPFASTTLGAMARVVQSDSIDAGSGYGSESHPFNLPGRSEHGQRESTNPDGGGADRRCGCYVRYKKAAKDWRIARLEKE
ncbi:hypothetical protein I316_00661 [Kwoniella heveanensis BCC8398]|uniref:Uncharacterized protein n=1 Tax=Kwoniella heveanensis BCC8398 TaxID=1296120 RepID=A0A1B9H2P0_9TREE|nr:hypothetical protein I316_00661 [Kwoniella heveanensis BCC8398]